MLSIFKSKGEKHFIKYLKHTEPLSGEVQDPALAREHLQQAVDLKHPDATFVMGALIFTGDGYPRSETDGHKMMVEAKKLGAGEISDQISLALGIDLSKPPSNQNIAGRRKSLTPIKELIWLRNVQKFLQICMSG